MIIANCRSHVAVRRVTSRRRPRSLQLHRKKQALVLARWSCPKGATIREGLADAAHLHFDAADFVPVSTWHEECPRCSASMPVKATLMFAGNAVGGRTDLYVNCTACRTLFTATYTQQGPGCFLPEFINLAAKGLRLCPRDDAEEQILVVAMDGDWIMQYGVSANTSVRLVAN